MESLTKLAWASLVLIHLTPALVFFAPGLVQKLYGIPPSGDLGVLLTHRGVLFLAICVAAGFAIFSQDSRRLATLVVGISMIGFLVVYARAGVPAGALRKIAITDLIGLAPLIFVSIQAWQ